MPPSCCCCCCCLLACYCCYCCCYCLLLPDLTRVVLCYIHLFSLRSTTTTRSSLRVATLDLPSFSIDCRSRCLLPTAHYCPLPTTAPATSTELLLPPLVQARPRTLATFLTTRATCDTQSPLPDHSCRRWSRERNKLCCATPPRQKPHLLNGIPRKHVPPTLCCFCRRRLCCAGSCYTGSRSHAEPECSLVPQGLFCQQSPWRALSRRLAVGSTLHRRSGCRQQRIRWRCASLS